MDYVDELDYWQVKELNMEVRLGGLNFLGKRVFVNTITGEAVSRDVLHHNDGHGGDNASPMIMFNEDLLIFFEKKALQCLGVPIVTIATRLNW